MANLDRPIGFWPIKQLDGNNTPAPNEYIVTTGATIYRGDLVTAAAAGTVGASTANDGVLVVGVAAEYVSDSGSAAGKKILIYDNPYTVFGVQADTGTSPAATAVFATANHVVGSGNATTKLSGHELDSSDIGTGLQCRILGKIDTPDNEWGEHVKLRVLLSEHAYLAAAASI